ncbi:hypothetical protein [Burkholderia seminalis]|uniref:hypothetical protein n=1 Tax=Burkholderia seminalis TaxID=488731 RepID=UPI000F5B323E|nr:hypothetical protein [Burkholderia seminalis]
METLQAVIDEERGYLDRRNGVACGFSGPTTKAYLRGYGDDHDMSARIRADHEFKNSYIEHGWH